MAQHASYLRRRRGLAGLRIAAVSAGIAALAAAASTASPQPPEPSAVSGKEDQSLAQTLASAHKTGWTAVIAQLHGELSESRRGQLRALGADVYRDLPVFRSVAMRVPNRELAAVAALPFVRHLSADVAVKKSDDFTVNNSGAGIAFAQYDLTGAGIGVAVVDSGVAMCPDLSTGGKYNRLMKSVTFVPGSGANADRCGHGTHVAGIVAGNGAASTGRQYFDTYYGIARQANTISVQVLDETGAGSVSTVLAGIQWVIQNRSAYNIRVMNLSLGHPVAESYTTDPLCQAVEAAWKSGIVVVCAAGNNGRLNSTQTAGMDNEGWGTAYGTIQSPANDPYVITVGAMKAMDGSRADDRVATYSSRGPSRLDFVMKPDIVAPGNQIISLEAPKSYLVQTYWATNEVPMSAYSYRRGSAPSNRYYRLSGTSMATPVVAGAAALMLQADPTLSPDTVKARLMVSADKWSFPDGSADACTFGAGYLDIPAALSCPVVAGSYAVSPTVSTDGFGNVLANVDPNLWGTGLSDLHAIWGHAFLGANASTTLSSSHALWGSSIWGDASVWSESSSAVDLTSTAIVGE